MRRSWWVCCRAGCGGGCPCSCSRPHVDAVVWVALPCASDNPCWRRWRAGKFLILYKRAANRVLISAAGKPGCSMHGRGMHSCPLALAPTINCASKAVRNPGCAMLYCRARREKQRPNAKPSPFAALLLPARPPCRRHPAAAVLPGALPAQGPGHQHQAAPADLLLAQLCRGHPGAVPQQGGQHGEPRCVARAGRLPLRAGECLQRRACG